MLLLFIGIRYPVNRLVALGHTYSFVLQPLRIIKKVPLLLFLHSDVQKTHEIKGRSILLRYLEYITEGFGIYGARMYTVSEVLMNTINNRHNILKPESTRVLRNEIAVPQQNDMKKKEIRCIRPPVRTACVGVLEPRKNQRFILDVFKKIPAEKAQLYLYGVGPDEQLLRDRVEKEGLTDQVHFMGWVQSDRIWPNVDLLLMPSLHEGAPLAVLEALGYGVAVLASAIPEHAEILPQEWLLPLANTTIWRNKITFLSDAPAVRLQEIISEQKIFAWELQFDWDEKFANCCIMS
jgi:glycosyltransferase involved in cell wall biosynthesis